LSDIETDFECYSALLAKANSSQSESDWDCYDSTSQAISEKYGHPTDDELAWLQHSLAIPEKAHFSAFILRDNTKLGGAFLQPLITAAVYETCPSTNKYFVAPAIANFGYRKVNEELYRFLFSERPFEQAGAINALYWAQTPLHFPANSAGYTFESATEESRALYQSIADIRAKIQTRTIELFISSEFIDVQRSALPRLNFSKPDSFPAEAQPLIAKAIQIASQHHDEYIRSRLQVQLGEPGALPPLPHRADKSS
jgi:hypothetical protein